MPNSLGGFLGGPVDAAHFLCQVWRYRKKPGDLPGHSDHHWQTVNQSKQSNPLSAPDAQTCASQTAYSSGVNTKNL